MMRYIFAVVASLYASTLFAEEEIYLYIRYNNDENGRVSHKMKCQDSRCMIESNAAERSIALTQTQRDQILEAFQTELNRFDINSETESSNRSVKVKLRYRSNTKRVDITQRLPADQLSVVSTELTTVFETYFPDLDLSRLGRPKPKTSDDKPAAPANKDEPGSESK